MILYQLRCFDGHEFEAWFKNSSAYDTQAAGGDVSCPYCASSDVTKAIMAPNITPSRSKAIAPAGDQNIGQKAEERALEVAEKILEAVDTLRTEVETNFDNVGDQFANEARRIHYGEADERGIYGEASDQESTDLDDEGIDVYRLPGRPRRTN